MDDEPVEPVGPEDDEDQDLNDSNWVNEEPESIQFDLTKFYLEYFKQIIAQVKVNKIPVIFLSYHKNRYPTQVETNIKMHLFKFMKKFIKIKIKDSDIDKIPIYSECSKIISDLTRRNGRYDSNIIYRSFVKQIENLLPCIVKTPKIKIKSIPYDISCDPFRYFKFYIDLVNMAEKSGLVIKLNQAIPLYKSLIPIHMDIDTSILAVMMKHSKPKNISSYATKKICGVNSLNLKYYSLKNQWHSLATCKLMEYRSQYTKTKETFLKMGLKEK